MTDRAGFAPDTGLAHRSTRRCVLVAVAAGAMFGPLDLAGQVHAPYPFANLFNSPAVWAAAGFGFGAWAHVRARAILGAVVLEFVAVVAYYVADVAFRGSDASILVSTTSAAWVVLGVGAGVIFGGAGAAISDPSNAVRAFATALLPGVFLAEASHQVIRHLTTDADSRPDDLVPFAILLAALAAAALAWILHGRGRADRVRSLGATLVVAVAGGVGYAVLTS